MESLWRKQIKIIEDKQGKESSGMPHSQDRHAGVLHAGFNHTRRDVIVIGAGMAGILTAYYLKERGKNVLVLEADKIASGQTGRTTAKITSQHGLKYSTLINTMGIKKAEMYAKANEEAIREYERLIKNHRISCQFEIVPAYLYTLQNEATLKKEEQAAKRLGIDAFFARETELPFPVAGALCFQNQAQFSPLEFIRYLSSNLEIWEQTKVTAVRGNQVVTNGRVLTADKIVVATHYPFLNIPGFYFLRQHQERSYVLALSGCRKINGMYYGVDKEGLSLRQAGDTLLLGGGSHRTGENSNGGSYDLLMQAAKQYFPGSRVEARWSAQDCMPHDGVPFIGRYSAFTPDLYVASGFQKWGMTSSMISALILRDELCGIENPYKKLFSPLRINFRAAAGNFILDAGMSVKGLSKGLLHRPKKDADSLPCGHGGIVLVDGKRFACCRDEAGELHMISARCSHMGCELEWNPDEKSWDCPCHGSRFDVDGNLLDNPSKKDR